MVRIVAEGATEQQLAAIAAAYEELWPKPPEARKASEPPTEWRFSGRWWHVGDLGPDAR